ncbi:response regulator [bacterium]|jgi:DNA-binding NtrC family response regulator|nr:response regulator [bacterium]MBP5591186.1 response regulator [bacterium]
MNKNINVLIIDDEESILSSLRRLLEDKGYNVVTNSDPAAAIEYMRNNLVHIALIDITMPNLDGLSVLSMIKDVNSLTQIIMMSAYATTDRVIAALENGANDFLLKPFNNLEHVVSIVEESEKKLVRWQGVLKQLGAL